MRKTATNFTHKSPRTHADMHMTWLPVNYTHNVTWNKQKYLLNTMTYYAEEIGW